MSFLMTRLFFHCLQHNALDLIERNQVVAAVVELGRPHAFRPECVAPESGGGAGGGARGTRPARGGSLDHGKDLRASGE
jgi:hypothetical protein